MSLQNFLDFDSLWDYSDPRQTETRFREILLQIPETNSAHLELLTQIARAQGLQQKFDKAMALLLEKHSPEFDPLYYTMRGDLYVAKGELNKARDAYKEALQKAGQDANTAQGIQMRLDVLGNN